MSLPTVKELQSKSKQERLLSLVSDKIDLLSYEFGDDSDNIYSMLDLYDCFKLCFMGRKFYPKIVQEIHALLLTSDRDRYEEEELELYDFIYQEIVETVKRNKLDK